MIYRLNLLVVARKVVYKLSIGKGPTVFCLDFVDSFPLYNSFKDIQFILCEKRGNGSSAIINLKANNR